VTGPLVLGIDGGGSKTLIALADESGRIVDRGRAGGINPLDNTAWRTLLEAELERFGRIRNIAAVVAALPAYGEVEAISAAQRETIASVFPGVPQDVVNDVDAAHLGAFAGGAGILILSGTGSMAWARDAEGRSYRVGGWGDLVGDEGSSHWIGMRILSAISQSIDGRTPPTALVDAVFATLGLDLHDPMNALEGWAAHIHSRRANIAALAPLASRLAEEGDAVAAAIIDAAADELARHVTAIGRLGGLAPDWSFAGGTFASRPLREGVAKRLGRPPRRPILPPIGGALLAAARRAGWPADNHWIDELARALGERTETAPAADPAADRQPQTTN